VTTNALLFAAACDAAVAITLAGVLGRRRAAYCWSFAFYLAAVLVCDIPILGWWERFYTHSFWIIRQAVFDLAKLAVAVELAWRAFRPFPGARPVAGTFVMALLAVTTTVLLMVPSRHPYAYAASVLDWHPRILTATIWLMTGTALLIVWYRIPITGFQKALLVGFVPYLVIFTTLLNLLGRRGWTFVSTMHALDGSAYLLVVSWWAWHAWRHLPEEQPLPQVLVDHLQKAS
jgi:hypothetical protein